MAMALLALGGGSAQAAVIAGFTFGTPSTPTLNATSWDANLLQPPSIGLGSGAGASSYDTGTGNLQPSFKFAAGNVVQNASFITFTVIASSGYKLNLVNLTFDAATFDPIGHWAVSTSVLEYGNNIAVGTDGDNKFVEQSVDLSSSLYQNLDRITFHLYDWNTGSKSDWYDNIQLNGSVVPVPEPANVALGLFAAGAGVVSLGRRFRNRKSAAKAA